MFKGYGNIQIEYNYESFSTAIVKKLSQLHITKCSRVGILKETESQLFLIVLFCKY